MTHISGHHRSQMLLLPEAVHERAIHIGDLVEPCLEQIILLSRRSLGRIESPSAASPQRRESRQKRPINLQENQSTAPKTGEFDATNRPKPCAYSAPCGNFTGDEFMREPLCVDERADLAIGSLTPGDMGDLGGEEIAACPACRLRDAAAKFAALTILAEMAADREAPLFPPQGL
jgi:hypothetical protein